MIERIKFPYSRFIFTSFQTRKPLKKTRLNIVGSFFHIKSKQRDEERDLVLQKKEINQMRSNKSLFF